MSSEVWDHYTFHIEHIYAKKHGGSDDPQNLCLACPECNWSKGVNLSGLVGDKIVPLFHPRRQAWGRHFAWDGPDAGRQDSLRQGDHYRARYQ
jgi:hypothetical protein